MNVIPNKIIKIVKKSTKLVKIAKNALRIQH